MNVFVCVLCKTNPRYVNFVELVRHFFHEHGISPASITEEPEVNQPIISYYVSEEVNAPFIGKQLPAHVICDFCGAYPVHAAYDCEDFKIAPWEMSRGHWAACRACFDLIDSRSLDALTRRVLSAYDAADSPELFAYLRKMYDVFMDKRKGSPTIFGPEVN